MRMFLIPALIATPTFFCAIGTSPTAPANIVIAVGSTAREQMIARIVAD